MKTIDARGFSCPEPLLMLKNGLKSDEDILLMTDSKNATQNCEDFAKKKGFSVDVTQTEGDYHLQIRKAK
ncbi:MAG: sulfurtransferase TusA family protein [Defluviitaleaceae bacterium]|nr:sulfurtransferase TusA family protein [Defluviitaleaceae bacterium]